MNARRPWLVSPTFDGLAILAPPLLCSAAVIACTPFFADAAPMPGWLFALLIVGVDVAHVYSTLYRTYFDKNAWQHSRHLLIAAPLLCWVSGALLYTYTALAFWRAVTYLAVFHFVRQQVGFTLLFGRHDVPRVAWHKHLDKAITYAATLYPLLYWHTHERAFVWFVDHDLVSLEAWRTQLMRLGGALYALLAVGYIGKEAFVLWTQRRCNVPRNLWILGTALSWFTGIVYVDSDLAFTVTNVLPHGIPYVALIWAYGRAHPTQRRPWAWPQHFTWRALPLFLTTLVLLAYAEEGLWDGLIWRDHPRLFQFFAVLPHAPSAILPWLVPLLALPQMSHYVIDGFIWRMRRGETAWLH